MDLQLPTVSLLQCIGYALVLGAIVAFLFIAYPKSSKELKREKAEKRV